MRPTTFFSLFLALFFAATALAEEPCIAPNLTPCAPIFLKGVEIREETINYSVELSYPVLCQAEATRTIRDHMTRTLADFKEDFPGNDPEGFRHKHQIHVDYSVWPSARGRLASVMLLVEVYTGGAHPNNWPVTWVFDMGDGTRLALSDIFKDERAALNLIAPMVRAVLESSLGQMNQPDMLADGTTPVLSNFDDFILTEDGVGFFFAPYQVAPYAAGMQAVTIPYAQLKDHLVPEIWAIVQ